MTALQAGPEHTGPYPVGAPPVRPRGTIKVWRFSFPSAEHPDLIVPENAIDGGVAEIRAGEVGDEFKVRIEGWDIDRFEELGEWCP